ncbi:MAG: hypothetical protein JWM54_1153 [Acidobacteriaceae bacterium]|nr:hypothetical protein [Acidobacteriaceae bacterium]
MKFIQITSARLENNMSTQANWILHALDEDGRIWEMDDMHGWREVPLPVPTPVSEKVQP